MTLSLLRTSWEDRIKSLNYHISVTQNNSTVFSAFVTFVPLNIVGMYVFIETLPFIGLIASGKMEKCDIIKDIYHYCIRHLDHFQRKN